MSVKEPIHSPPICEECERWSTVIYKCSGIGFDWWAETGYKQGIETTVVHLCYKCAFDGDNS